MKLKITLAVEYGMSQDQNVFSINVYGEEVDLIQKIIDGANMCTNDSAPKMWIQIEPNVYETPIPVTDAETMGDYNKL